MVLAESGTENLTANAAEAVDGNSDFLHVSFPFARHAGLSNLKYVRRTQRVSHPVGRFAILPPRFENHK